MSTSVIISLTSIFQRQHSLLNTLQSCIKQSFINELLSNKYYLDKIIINLSEDPYLLDTGFTNKLITNNQLLEFINKHKDVIEINWVQNTGPYRKLLSTVEKFWNDPEQIIITIDDDITLSEKFIQNLLLEYESNNWKACIAYRGHTMNWKSFSESENNIKYYTPKSSPNPLIKCTLYNFSTNGAGTLWTPSMFQKHPSSKDLLFDYDKIKELCPTADDIWYNFIRILNGIELCFINSKNRKQMYSIKSDRTTALYYKINSKTIIDNTRDIQNTHNIIDKNTQQLRNIYNLVLNYI
jgi:hypothetical protein